MSVHDSTHGPKATEHGHKATDVARDVVYNSEAVVNGKLFNDPNVEWLTGAIPSARNQDQGIRLSLKGREAKQERGGSGQAVRISEAVKVPLRHAPPTPTAAA